MVFVCKIELESSTDEKFEEKNVNLAAAAYTADSWGTIKERIIKSMGWNMNLLITWVIEYNWY